MWRTYYLSLSFHHLLPQSIISPRASTGRGGLPGQSAEHDPFRVVVDEILVDLPQEDLEVNVVAVDAERVGEVVADVIHPKVDDPHDEGGDGNAVAEGGDESDGHREAVEPRHYRD